MLERIEVRDYQSLKDIDLPLGSFTVIVGPSGNGKSSLIRALKAICFNQAGHRFISHGRQRAWVRLTLDGGQTIEWEKLKEKSATYTSDDHVYTRTGRAVPEEIENLIGIRRIEIDKGLSFTPQFHSQNDGPLLLTESSTLAARALAKLTKLSVLVEAQMDCRRDLKRAQRQHSSAEEEAEHLRAQLAELPNVRRARNVVDRAKKWMRKAKERLAVANQAEDIVHDISGSLLIADLILPRPEDADALVGRVDELEEIVATVRQIKTATAATDVAQVEVKQALEDQEQRERQYEELVEELGTCPLCGSAEMWGEEHKHEVPS